MRYHVLSLCESYGISPGDWPDLDRDTRMDMLAKRLLEVDRENRIQKENSES